MAFIREREQVSWMLRPRGSKRSARPRTTFFPGRARMHRKAWRARVPTPPDPRRRRPPCARWAMDRTAAARLPASFVAGAARVAHGVP